MITYELAKQLKEAGFPQEFKVGDYYQVEGHGDEKPYLLHYEESVEHPFAPSGIGTAAGSVARINANKNEVSYIKIPTLSELIDFVDGNDRMEATEQEYARKALLKLRENKANKSIL